jgi:hypothetical protein
MKEDNPWKIYMSQVRSEPFCVVIHPIHMPYRIRLTYNSIKGKKLIEIEELDNNEQVVSNCTFRGSSANGSGSYWMSDFRDSIKSIKPMDWVINKEIFVDMYYKKVA